MTDNQTTIRDQAATLKLKGYSNGEVMRLLKCSRTTVKRANADIKAGKYQPDEDTRAIDRIDGATRTIIVNGLSEAVRSAEDMLRFFDVDPNIWQIRRQDLNTWGSVANPNAQRKLILERVPGSGVYEDYLRAAMAHAPKEHATYSYAFKATGKMLAISIHDLHYGLQAWGKETGEDYDITIAEQLYLSAVAHYRDWAAKEGVEKIMFLVGSDFFNVNSKLNTSVKGTPQDEDDRWKKTFVQGREMAVKAIEQLRKVAPIEVVVAGGNHDEERVFMLGDSLYCFFSNCDGVAVDNDPAVFKFKKWGRNLLGICHGHDVKPVSLPMVMAQDAPAWMWAGTEFREFLCGHLHHDKRGYFEPVVDKDGVRVRFAPSLVAASRWEHGKGYRSARECLGTIYDKDHGPIMEIAFRPCMVGGER